MTSDAFTEKLTQAAKLAIEWIAPSLLLKPIDRYLPRSDPLGMARSILWVSRLADCFPLPKQANLPTDPKLDFPCM